MGRSFDDGARSEILAPNGGVIGTICTDGPIGERNYFLALAAPEMELALVTVREAIRYHIKHESLKDALLKQIDGALSLAWRDK